MKNLVVYYSFSGSSRKIARSILTSINADCEEIREVRELNRLGVFTLGVWKVIRRKGSDILPICSDIHNYENIIVVTPVWLGSPVPAIYSFIRGHALEGKNVYCVLCCSVSSGKSKEIFQKELHEQGATCKDIIEIHSDDITMDAFKRRVIYFDMDAKGVLSLKSRDDQIRIKSQ